MTRPSRSVASNLGLAPMLDFGLGRNLTTFHFNLLPMLSAAKQDQLGMETAGRPLRVGMTYDTRDDFKFASNQPEDWDAEFAVSVAVDDIAHALEDLGHRIEFVGSGRKLLDRFHDVENSVDIVFNIAEGYAGRGREARIPALLELAGIPYVGSDSYALALALNKWHTKALASSNGVRTPPFYVVRNLDEMKSCGLEFPVIAKLSYEGSSKGLRQDSVAHSQAELDRVIQFLLREYKQPVIVEKFIEGKEIDVPIIGTAPTKAFGIVGITLNDSLDLGKRFLTSNIVKDDAYGFKYPIDGAFIEEAEQSALMIYNLVECSDFGRVDMRIDDSGAPYFLEINPYPFLGKHSSFNAIATASGVGYTGMIGMILASALQRYEISQEA
jgi:D-alanine-D-alanine ligase